jgi:O-antigen ligase
MITFNVLDKPKVNYWWSIIDNVLIALFIFIVPAFSDRDGIFHILSLTSIGFVICSLLLHLLFTYGFFIHFSVLSFLVFAFSVLLSSALSNFNGLSTTVFSMILLLLVFYFYYSSSLSNLFHFLLSLITGGFLFSVYFFLIYHADILSFNFSRIGDYFTNVNRIGDSFAISFCATLLILFFFSPKKWFWKTILCIFLGFFFVFSAFTGSKAAILLEIAAVLVCVFAWLPLKKRPWLIFFVAFSFLLFLGLIKIPAFSRFSDMFSFILGDSTRDLSSSERLSMFAQGFFFFGQRPLFGYGIDGFLAISGFGKYSHNTVSELLCDFGIFGFVSYEAPLFYSLAKLNKKNKVSLGFGLVFLVIIVFLQVSFPVFSYKMNSLVYGAFCAFIPRCSYNEVVFGKKHPMTLKTGHIEI